MSQTMLAAVYHGPNDLRVEQRAVPEITADELLLRVVSTSICGTDLRILHGGHRMYPQGTVRVPGHEVVGDIAAVGANVKGLREGQRVFIAPNMGCGHCRQCISGSNNLCASFDALGITIDGSFAEYMRVPSAAILQGNVFALEANIDPEAAALVEPLACVLRGQNATDTRIGDIVVIIGAGPIGLMHLMLARLRGASRVIVSQRSPERLEVAKALGADVTVTPDRLADAVGEASHGDGADVVIVAAPSAEAQASAVRIAAIGGRINFFGGLPKEKPTVEIDANMIHYRELVVTGTTACSTKDCRDAAALVNAGRLDLSPLISARYPLRDAVEAFAVTESRKALKVVLRP